MNSHRYHRHQQEGYCSQLCQHPTCWQAHRLEERGIFTTSEKRDEKNAEYEGLPTQNILNMSVDCDEAFPFDSDHQAQSSANMAYQMALLKRVLNRSKQVVQNPGIGNSEDRQSQEIKKVIRTLDPDDLIGDASDAHLPNKLYVWVPNPHRKLENANNSNRALSHRSKVTITNLSVNHSLSLPKYPAEPGAHSARLQLKPQFGRNPYLKQSKESSTFLSSSIGHEPLYVSPNVGSSVDQRSLPGQLSRTQTITFPENWNPGRATSSFKNNKNTPVPHKQVEMEKENVVTEVTPSKCLPPVNAVKYERTKSEFLKTPKYTSILLEPDFEFCQRKSRTFSGTQHSFNYGLLGPNPEPSAYHRQNTHTALSGENDPDYFDARDWFKIEVQPLNIAKKSITVPYGNQNSTPLSNSAPTTLQNTSEGSPIRKPISSLSKDKSSTSLKEANSLPPTSPLRRTGSKIVTFAPASRSMSSCSIPVAKSPPVTRRQMSAVVKSTRPLLETIIGDIGTCPPSSPLPPPPSPVPKVTIQEAEAAENEFITDAGDSESELTLTARPPTNIEDESIIGTPARSNFARSRESTREQLTTSGSSRDNAESNGNKEKENEGKRKIEETEVVDDNHALSSDSCENITVAGEETDVVAMEKLASEMVTGVLAAACNHLVEMNVENDENKAIAVDEAISKHSGEAPESWREMNYATALRPKYPLTNAESSAAEHEIQDAQRYDNELDQFDVTEDDLNKELQQEYIKL